MPDVLTPEIVDSPSLRLVACPQPFSTSRIDLTLPAGGTLVDFPGADDTISFGQGGLSHGNGNVSVFFGGTATVDATENWAGAIAGTGVDTYAWGIGDNNAWRFTLRDVAHLAATGTGPVQGRVYTVGMGYTDSTSVRFHIYDHTTEAQITPETVLSASVPGQVAAASVIGNADDGSGSWARRLSFTYIWNRVLTDAERADLYYGSSGNRFSTDYANARIDEVGFWRKALSNQEVLDLWNAGNANTYNSVVSNAGWGIFDFGASNLRWLTVAAGTGILASSNRGIAWVAIATDRGADYQYFERSRSFLIATS